MNTTTKRVDELVTGDVIPGEYAGYTITIDGPGRSRSGPCNSIAAVLVTFPATASNGWVGVFEHRADHRVAVLA